MAAIALPLYRNRCKEMISREMSKLPSVVVFSLFKYWESNSIHLTLEVLRDKENDSVKATHSRLHLIGSIAWKIMYYIYIFCEKIDR